ncbi:hypothetical protein [Agrobacterium tumefaciens]|uniref:hypothetical protein n=1 Tax=Agrobacterium tumefaciens TaxID=358 RepID=UPI003BA1C3EB
MEGNTWHRTQAEDRIREVLDAAKGLGPQVIVDVDGRFEVVFHPGKQSLEELFSREGPIKSE